MDYIKILGIKKGNTFEDVKKKASRLFKKYHSDKNSPYKSPEKFKEVYDAYSYVRDNPGILNITPQEDHKYIAFTVKITIEDIYLGTKKFIRVKRIRFCSHCSGSGSDTGVSGECATCNGSGYVKGKVLKLMGMDDKCAVCSGTGRVSGSTCKKCKGAKIDVEEAVLYFSIDIANCKRKTLTLEGEGHQIGSNLFGNIIISLEIEDNPHVAIEEDHFHIYAKILPIQNIIGDKAEIKMFGRKLVYSIDKGSEEAMIQDRVKSDLIQNIKISFIKVQPFITEKTHMLYKEILEIEKSTKSHH